MKLRRIFLLIIVIGLATLVWSYPNTVSDPVIRRTEAALLPGDTVDKQLSLLLISDIHVAGPDMPTERLARIVAGINELHPDIILIAGDLVSDKNFRPGNIRWKKLSPR